MGIIRVLRHLLLFIILICFFIVLWNPNMYAETDLLPVQINGKWGYTNNEMLEEIPPQWDFASYFRACEVAKVGLKQRDGGLLFGLIDVKGNYLVPCEYIIIDGESEAFFGGEDGYYLIMDTTRTLCGYFDIQNRYFCKPTYEDVDIWFKNNENIIDVAKKNEDGRVYINALSGEQIGIYQYIITFPWHKIAAICMSFDENWWIQYIDGTREKIGSNYDVRSDISHGLFIVKNQNDKYSLMNLQATIVADWYAYIELTPDGLFYGESMQYSGIIYCQIE
ncbi:MAG: WG repeat-containing protein [Clostridia bacterium]|nr:WG repeat-containing protein [Clostridia bacterium]